MKITLLACILVSNSILAQTFELSGGNESYRGHIGETIKAPVKIKNNTDKAITLVIRKLSAEIGAMQKNYYCLDNSCLDSKIEDYTLRLEPEQTVATFQVALEAGLSAGQSNVRYLVFNKNFPADAIEFDVNFIVDERGVRQHIFTSKDITLYDLYPNPVSDYAQVDYKVYNDQVKAKIILHNILGNSIDEYPLPPLENKLKIRAETLSAGIYFYTLYLDNEGVMTRKLIVKK